LKKIETSVVKIIKNCFILCNSEKIGGAIKSDVSTQFEDCLFDRCKVEGNINTEGGGIYSEGGASLTIYRCTFASCESANDNNNNNKNNNGGGGISFSGNGKLEILNTSFETCICYNNNGGNEIERNNIGGGVKIYNSGGYFYNCSFLNCRSEGYGGGIGEVENTSISSEEILEIVNCPFISNYGGISGGGIGLKRMSISCSNCSFLHNSADDAGSAFSGDLKFIYIFKDCSFLNNFIEECASWGGGGTLFINPNNCSGIINLENIIFSKSTKLQSCTEDNNSIFIQFLFYFTFF
jgi:hypothetical protein